MKFYALAIDEYGETQVIANLPETSRIDAVKSAKQFCKVHNMELKTVYPVYGTGKQPDIMTKMTPEKRRRKVWF